MPYEKKKKRNWFNYLPYVFLIVLIANGLLIFIRVSPALQSEQSSHQVRKERVAVQLGGREYDNTELSDDKYRQLALEMDRELVNALRLKKEWRQRDQANEAEDPMLYHEQRIQDLEFDLAENFDAKSISVEGSIGYELQQTIERMKEDAPARN